MVISFSKQNFDMLIVLVHLNPSKWQDDFFCLSNFLSGISNTNVILLGDFNVVISDSQSLPEGLGL